LARLTIRTKPDERQIERERREAFLQLSGEERLRQMIELIEFTMRLNPTKPYKKPQGLGIVLYRQTED
jgi:hypothetical protein